MMDEFNCRVAKYANEMNDITFHDFSEQELNMLFALITNMKEREAKRAIFSYSEMKKAMGLGNTHMTNAEFKKKMMKMWEKLNKVTCRIQTETALISFVLFPTFTMEDDKSRITIAVNPDFAFMLNRLTNYTYFRLEKFIDVKGKYAKLLYTHLCQFRKSGRYYVSLEDLRRLLDVPASYDTKTVNRRVVKESVEKLCKMKEFEDLKCNPQYLSKRGGTVSGYEFVWKVNPKETEGKHTELSVAEPDASGGKPAVSIEDVIAMCVEDVAGSNELEEADEEDELLADVYYGD